MNRYYLDKINESYKISEYLSDNGIHPKRQSGDRLVYLCPLPGHSSDSHPSFFVYDKGDHEDFVCFGCKRGGEIINFIKEYENISFKDAITKLSKGINLDVSDALEYLVAEAGKSAMNQTSDNDVLQSAMYISSLCNNYLNEVDFDSEELRKCEKLFPVIDDLMMRGDYETLFEYIELLPEYLSRSFNSYSDNKERDRRDSLSNWEVQ